MTDRIAVSRYAASIEQFAEFDPMAIDPKFKGTVYGCTVLAFLIGLWVGWVPGVDVPFLILLWIIGGAVIIGESGAGRFANHWLRFTITIAFAGSLLVTGTKIVASMTLIAFWVLNPILDAIATYRLLRAVSKLYVRKDAEEMTSNAFSVIWSIARDVLLLLLGVFGFAA